MSCPPHYGHEEGVGVGYAGGASELERGGRDCEGLGVWVRRLRWSVFWAGSVLDGYSWVGAAFDRLVSSPWVLNPRRRQ